MRIHPAHTVPGTARATGTVRIAPIAVPMPRCSATWRVLACWGCRAIHNPISIHEERAVNVEASPATRAIVAATAARTLGELFQESVAKHPDRMPTVAQRHLSVMSWPRCRQTSLSTSSPYDSTGPSRTQPCPRRVDRCRAQPITPNLRHIDRDAATSRGNDFSRPSSVVLHDPRRCDALTGPACDFPPPSPLRWSRWRARSASTCPRAARWAEQRAPSVEVLGLVVGLGSVGGRPIRARTDVPADRGEWVGR